MYVDGGVSNDLNAVGAQAAEMEDMGYTGVMTAETAHDPFSIVGRRATYSASATYDLNRCGLCAFTNDFGKYWPRSERLLERSLCTGPWIANTSAHHQTIQYALV